MPTGLKNLYFRNINNSVQNKKKNIINLDVEELLNNNIDIIVKQNELNELNVEIQKKITINTIKNINNRLYLLE